MFNKELDRKRERLGVFLGKYLPQENCYPPSVHQAMRYAALSVTGRYWGILTLFAAEACNGEEEKAMPVACAIECVNAFSLVHEGLPGIGNQSTLGHQPSVHAAFGEGIAVLAGDALLMSAFQLVNKHVEDDRAARALVGELCAQIGPVGMLGGFVMGILSVGRSPDAKTVEYVYSHKTGSLGAAAAAMGGLVAGATDEERRALADYGLKVGTAMSIAEDVGRAERNVENVGRGRRGAAKAEEAPMDFVRLLGFEKSKQKAVDLTREAVAGLKSFGRRAGKLAYFANYFLYTDRGT